MNYEEKKLLTDQAEWELGEALHSNVEVLSECDSCSA